MMKDLYVNPAVIENIAAKLHKKYSGEGQSMTMVGLDRLATDLGATVQLAEFPEGNISARVFEDRDRKGEYIIQIANNEPRRRQKFSIAHEVGHIIFHKVDKVPLVEYRQSILNYASPDDLYKETQANVFASALLIPEGMARAAWDEHRDIDDIAEIFDVSRSAAFVRLSSLGLLEND